MIFFVFLRFKIKKMTYSEAIQYLYNHAPMFQQHGKTAYKAGLETTLALDAHFGHSHRGYRTIHVAGTNGKGSTSHMLAAILQSAGYKVGLYTSPHLRDFRERIRINGDMISEQRVIDFIAENQEIIEHLQPSFFEITTALALLCFAEEKVDVAVVEVGLGGRLDCTNIISPTLSIITNISLDHTDILGDTLEKIATEKAGIIKHETPVVIGETQAETAPIFKSKAEKEHAPIVFADKIKRNSLPTCELKGIYQEKNLKTVLAAVEILQQHFAINEAQIAHGLQHTTQLTGLQGRWQTLSESPHIICDTGHNIGGFRYIAEQLKLQNCDQLHIVFGVVSDKNSDAILEILPKNAVYYFTQAQIPRALNADILQQRATNFGLKGNAYHAVKEALNAAKSAAKENDLIFVGGSNYVIAEINQ